MNRSGNSITVALRFAYDGARFDAYARDPALASTVEGALMEAAVDEGFVDGSWRTGSRTDAGVSARCNVARMAVQRPHLKGLVPAMNSRLPPGVWVTGASPVHSDWNPRYAQRRTYRYVAPQAGENQAAIERALATFVGEHDMAAFARYEEGRNPRRRIDEATVCTTHDHAGWWFTIAGPNFLWNQVRRMVGAALAVGQGKAAPEDVAASLETGAPHPNFKTAPAAGLLLWDIAYKDGLAWDVEAGGLERAALAQGWQAAKVHAAMLDALRA